MALRKLVHPLLLRLTVLLHCKITTSHVVSHLLHVLRMALPRGSRGCLWRLCRLRLLLLLLLVRRSYLVWHLNCPWSPHGATVYEGLPVSFILHAGIDSHLTTSTTAVRNLRNWRVVIL